jgi:hypothetical protein
MRFTGHFDKMVMRQGTAAMRDEFEPRLPIAAQAERVISYDHQTPPGVSCQDWQIYMALFWTYAQEAGHLSRRQTNQLAL